MSPEYRLVKSSRPEHRPSIDSIVEEHDQRRSPIVADRESLLPASQLRQLVGGKIQSVEIFFCQIVPTSDITLRFRAGESR